MLSNYWNLSLLCPTYKAMGYMLSHYLNLPPPSALQNNGLHCSYMISHYLNLPPSAPQSNGLHAKSLFKSSPHLPYNAMAYMLSHCLNLPSSALQSNCLHAKSLFKSSPPRTHLMPLCKIFSSTTLKEVHGWKFRSPSSHQLLKHFYEQSQQAVMLHTGGKLTCTMYACNVM